MTENAQAAGPNREFQIQRVYIKDISFETPNSPMVFTEDWTPESNLNLNSTVNKLDDDLYEVVLTVTVTTKLGDKTAYLVEVQQAGIFTVRSFPEEEMGHLMGAYCPNLLFPYARETIATVIQKGGFPEFVLQPINFDALYQQGLEQQQAKAGEAADAGASH